MFTEYIALACLAWYSFIVAVCTIGYIQLFKYYRKVPDGATCLSHEAENVPHVTVIRPCKGVEPYLYECLASTFLQDYPSQKLTIHFCVGSRDDPAFPTVQQVLRDYKNRDARVFVEEEDPKICDEHGSGPSLGPNPKIRNMSRAYREAKDDIIWIVDCNVWLGRGTCGRMVDKLCGYSKNGSSKPYKFVHHLPISVDVDFSSSLPDKSKSQTMYDESSTTSIAAKSSQRDIFSSLNKHGGRLEELFLSSSHAKMYVAINTVAIAPCIVGKSNMFRRSHLDFLTTELVSSSKSSNLSSSSIGIDYFSYNICEDHLIGDLLWHSKIPDSPNILNHGLVLGDLAIQPIAGMSVTNYIARRIRWLRVRKFTVPLATLVEPGTESFLCSAYGAFGLTTSNYTKSMFGSTWIAFVSYWLISISIWALIDWTVYILLHSGWTIDTPDTSKHTDIKEQIPTFAKPPTTSSSLTRRPFNQWFLAWLGRESLALPIWTWAIWGGTTVTWRERKFWVGMDMRVHEVLDNKIRKEGNGHVSQTDHSKKSRLD